MTQLFQKITAHRLIRQQIKSLESLTAPEEKFLFPPLQRLVLFYSSCSVFFLLLGPTTTFSAEAAFLVGGIEASTAHRSKRPEPRLCEREGEAGWVEEEEERRRLGGSKEATAFAAGNPLVSRELRLAGVYLPALSINWRIRTVQSLLNCRGCSLCLPLS